jgi:hypothetical protein
MRTLGGMDEEDFDGIVVSVCFLSNYLLIVRCDLWIMLSSINIPDMIKAAWVTLEIYFAGALLFLSFQKFDRNRTSNQPIISHELIHESTTPKSHSYL